MTIKCCKCGTIPLTYECYKQKNYCLKCIYGIRRHLLSDEELDKIMS